MGQVQIADSAFGSGQYTTYVGPGAARFTLATGATSVATYQTGIASASNNQPAAVRFTYGSGRGMLVGPEFELEETTELDWTAWDNLDASFYDPDSEWPLVARIVEWVNTGSVLNDTIISPAPIAGSRFAVYSTRNADGGAFPGLLPAVGRSLEFSGNTPIAIRDTEVKNNRLTRTNFDSLVMPGGYAYGYKTQLNGYEPNVRSFVSAGGGYVGISAGTFYAADNIVWLGKKYFYPLDIYLGRVIGPLDDIALWPTYALTPLHVNDPAFGDFTIQGLYWGEGYLELPSPSTQPVDTAATFAYSGTYAGQPAIVKHNYGSGRVIQPNMHWRLRRAPPMTGCSSTTTFRTARRR